MAVDIRYKRLRNRLQYVGKHIQQVFMETDDLILAVAVHAGIPRMIAVFEERGVARLYPVFAVRQAKPMKAIAPGLPPRDNLFDWRKREIDEQG